MRRRNAAAKMAGSTRRYTANQDLADCGGKLTHPAKSTTSSLTAATRRNQNVGAGGSGPGRTPFGPMGGEATLPGASPPWGSGLRTVESKRYLTPFPDTVSRGTILSATPSTSNADICRKRRTSTCWASAMERWAQCCRGAWAPPLAN